MHFEMPRQYFIVAKIQSTLEKTDSGKWNEIVLKHANSLPHYKTIQTVICKQTGNIVAASYMQSLCALALRDTTTKIQNFSI